MPTTSVAVAETWWARRKCAFAHPTRPLLWLPPLIIHVDAHRTQQHQALDDLLIVDADAEDGHAVVHHAHDHGADHGAADTPDAAIGRGAADEAGGDDVE